MKDLLDKEIENKEPVLPKRIDYWTDSLGNVRPLSKKAQEMKIFLEHNPIPKEFLKS